MAIKSINWWIDIEEFSGGALYNTFSAGPIARSWDDSENSSGSQKFITVQELIDEINNLFLEAWDNGDGRTKNLYEVLPKLRPSAETYSRDTPGQATIQFEFVRKYPLSDPEGSGVQQFSIALTNGPHGSQTLQEALPQYPAATVSYDNEASVQAVTVPYWQTSTVISDHPPIAPDVTFVPFLGISDKILILLDGNMGDLDLKPVYLKDTDVAFLAEEILTQLKVSIDRDEVLNYINSNNVTLNYKSDDPLKEYQIFRIEQKPSSYLDFNTPNNPIATVNEMVAHNKPATAATYISTIQPNVKYYYCVRGLDVHNNFSNPTDVFEIEMVNNSGQIYYSANVLDMSQAANNKNRLAGRKKLYIAPALQQTIYDQQKFLDSNEIKNKPQNLKITDLPPSNMLGYLEDDGTPVWDKRFKIRVTSAKTGKKIDLNITVKNSGVNIP